MDYNIFNDSNIRTSLQQQNGTPTCSKTLLKIETCKTENFNNNCDAKYLMDMSGISENNTKNKIPITRATWVFAMCAAVNSCNLGFDIGVNTGAGILLQESMELSDVQLEVFMGSLNFFAIIGALCASYISDKFGRRGGFTAAAIGFLIGVTIMSTAQTFTILMIGRLWVGLGVGFGLAIDPLYISEIAPPEHRGRLVTWSEIAINVGILIGFSSGLIFYKLDVDVAWRAMFFMGNILPLLLLFLIWNVMPESPRWLIRKGKEYEAKLVLDQIYPPGHDTYATLRDIQESIVRDKEAAQAVGWKAILNPSPAFRRMLVVGIGTAVAQPLVGIEAIQYFLVYIINESGIQDRGAQTKILIFLGFLKVVTIFIAGKNFDSKGRRPLMFTSLIGMIFALILIAFSLLKHDLVSAIITIIGLALYLSFFSVGMGPGAWLIPSEVFSDCIRAKAMSLATFSNRVVGTIMTSTFLSVANYLTWSGFFFLLAFICLCILGFFYVYLPETKGKSLEDMALYFTEITGDSTVLAVEEKLEKSQKKIPFIHPLIS